ncbi:MAG TPA: hypothetical protein VI756_25080 [Blastocatellia bacterium]
MVKAANEFLVSLRLLKGFDQEKFERLCQVLRQCKDVWRDREDIPKAAVVIMLDLFPVTSSLADRYAERPDKGVDGDEVFNAAVTLNSLAVDVVSPLDDGGSGR